MIDFRLQTDYSQFMKWNKHFLAELQKFSVPRRPALFLGESYIGAGESKLTFLNLKTSDVRSLLKTESTLFSHPVEQQFKVFQDIWFSADTFELKILPLYWLESLSIDQLLLFSQDLIQWATEVDNWALADSLCSHYAKIFEHAPKKLNKTFLIWNRHSEPWLRRMSMVSLMYYSRARRKYPPFKTLEKFVLPHLHAKEYYVQKAVGWTLREFYNVYPLETIEFIKNHLHQIHADAWYAATEKLDLKLKSKLVDLRRRFRKEKKIELSKKPKNGALERI